MFNSTQLNVIQYCAQECERQGSGETSVYHMVGAWNFAVSYERLGRTINDTKIYSDFIERLGRHVDPVKNANGLRRVPVGVGNQFEWHEKARWERIPDLLERLIESYYEGNLDPNSMRASRHLKKAKTAEDVFYYEYENIHPFVDGNGRTGKILYNYLLGTLSDPRMPPNFWNISNP